LASGQIEHRGLGNFRGAADLSTFANRAFIGEETPGVAGVGMHTGTDGQGFWIRNSGGTLEFRAINAGGAMATPGWITRGGGLNASVAVAAASAVQIGADGSGNPELLFIASPTGDSRRLREIDGDIELYDNAATPVQIGSIPRRVRTTATQTFATTTATAMTSLVFAMTANTTYHLDFYVPYTANATTTGIGFGLDVPTGATYTMGFWTGTTATATEMQSPITDAAVLFNSASRVTARQLARGSAVVINGANAGNCQLMCASEVAVASGIITQVGSTLEWRS
jgi:hypothetical protein